MTRSPSPRRSRHHQRWVLSFVTLRTLPAVSVFALFGGVCLAALVDSTYAV